MTSVPVVAAAQKAVLAARDLVGYSPLTLFVPQSVAHILLDAILLPTAISVMKCDADTSNNDPVSAGNARADASAKAAAQKGDVNVLLSLLPNIDSHIPPPAHLTDLQQRATPDEKARWKTAGCVVVDGV